MKEEEKKKKKTAKEEKSENPWCARSCTVSKSQQVQSVLFHKYRVTLCLCRKRRNQPFQKKSTIQLSPERLSSHPVKVVLAPCFYVLFQWVHRFCWHISHEFKSLGPQMNPSKVPGKHNSHVVLGFMLISCSQKFPCFRFSIILSSQFSSNSEGHDVMAGLCFLRIWNHHEGMLLGHSGLTSHGKPQLWMWCQIPPLPCLRHGSV